MIKPMKKNKKGAIIDMIVFVIMALVITIFIGVWIYGVDLISDTMSGINATIGTNTNFSDIAKDTIGQVNSANQTMLPIVAFALIFGMVLTIFVSNFLVKVHPAFFFVYLAILVLAIVLSVHVSNTYESLLTGEVFSNTLQSMTASTFILLNLPLWTTVVGFVGMIILFAGIIRDRELGGII